METLYTHLHNRGSNRFPILIPSFYVPFQVDIEELEDKIQLLICMYDIQQTEITSKC
jgi:hypothetical protein